MFACVHRRLNLSLPGSRQPNEVERTLRPMRATTVTSNGTMAMWCCARANPDRCVLRDGAGRSAGRAARRATVPLGVASLAGSLDASRPALGRGTSRQSPAGIHVPSRERTWANREHHPLVADKSASGWALDTHLYDFALAWRSIRLWSILVEPRGPPTSADDSNAVGASTNVSGSGTWTKCRKSLCRRTVGRR